MSIKVIGIAGGSGSGKTTLCRAIASQLGSNGLVISSDNYYRPQDHLSVAERAGLNFDHPDALELDLLREHLALLRNGKDVPVPQYCFKTHTRLPQSESVSPKPVVLVEGILLFVHEALREALDLRIFVHADDEVRLSRRMIRDTQERARTPESVEGQWATTVSPMYAQFVEPNKRHAEITINTNRPNVLSTELISSAIANLGKANATPDA